MELYRTLDYWQCRELIDISNSGRINAETKLQSSENQVFNAYLDKYSNRKFAWFSLENMNLWSIKTKTIELINGQLLSGS